MDGLIGRRGLPDLREALKTADLVFKLPLQSTVAIGEALIEGGDLMRMPFGRNPFEAVAIVVRKGLELPLQVAKKGGEIVGPGRTDKTSGARVRTSIF